MGKKNKLLLWQKRKSPLLRQIEIFSVVSQLALGIGIDECLGKNTPQKHHHRAKWLVNHLIELGPTFIKIGQALSTRPDLIPLEYIQELGQLQDRVPQFSPTEAVAVIEAEFGKSVYALYKDFERFPLASASLGQVHKATLHTGEAVVVKVQRPGLEQLLKLDRKVLDRLIGFANRFLPWSRKYHFEEIYQEFFALLYKEIDYLHEGKNADRFRENFKDYNQVMVPKIYWKYTTKKVLTLEYLPGIKIDNRQQLEAQNINKDNVIQLGICCYLKQLLQDGFFQSDPHPGNMAVNNDGKIIFYDFGTMAEVQSMAKDQMIGTFFAVLRNDTDEVVQKLVYMGLIEPMQDMTPVKRMVAFLLENFRDKPVDIRAFEQIGSELYIMFEKQPFRLPPQMTFIIKSLTTLDGIARALDPQYNLLAASQPFIKNITLSNNNGNVLSSITQQAKAYFKYKLNQPSRTELAIKKIEERLEVGELQFRVRDVENERFLRVISLGIKSLVYTCLTGFSFLSFLGLIFLEYQGGAIALFCLTLFFGFGLIKSLIRLIIRDHFDRLARK
jgi:predicted unusual protein kinase regulating ubiquinone biosynthesis (AarF/ABC1/UbiB family)